MHNERDFEGAFFLQIKCSNILQKARLGLKKKKIRVFDCKFNGDFRSCLHETNVIVFGIY